MGDRSRHEMEQAVTLNSARSLGALADPTEFCHPLAIEGSDAADLIRQLEIMQTIRFAEEQIAELVLAGKARCPCHLGIGQEAIAVGVAAHLRPTDRVFGTHRSHPHFLAMGGELLGLLAEVLGRVDGCSHGMGGSMHLYDGAHGFLGSVPIVGATIPLAVGAALAAKKDGRGDMAVCFFGDGAAEEGVLHESLNLAATFRLPVVFVCENNLFSSHLHINLRQPDDSVARYAQAHKIPASILDGNDLVAVSDAAKSCITAARNGEGPSFLEMVTYRWRGHVGASENIDVGLHRNEDLPLWKRRDPIRRLAEGLEQAGELSATRWEAIRKKAYDRVKECSDRAERSPFPEPDRLLAPVFFTTNSVQ